MGHTKNDGNPGSKITESLPVKLQTSSAVIQCESPRLCLFRQTVFVNYETTTDGVMRGFPSCSYLNHDLSRYKLVANTSTHFFRNFFLLKSYLINSLIRNQHSLLFDSRLNTTNDLPPFSRSGQATCVTCRTGLCCLICLILSLDAMLFSFSYALFPFVFIHLFFATDG